MSLWIQSSWSQMHHCILQVHKSIIILIFIKWTWPEFCHLQPTNAYQFYGKDLKFRSHKLWILPLMPSHQVLFLPKHQGKTSFQRSNIYLQELNVLAKNLGLDELETAFNHSQGDKPSRNSGTAHILKPSFGQNSKYKVVYISLGDF